MNKYNKFTIGLLLLPAFLFLHSCKKEIRPDQINHLALNICLSESGNQTGLWVNQTADKGHVLYCLEDLNQSSDFGLLTVSKLNAYGKIIWKEKYLNDTLNSFYNINPDGSVLFASSDPGTLLKFDREGNELFKTKYSDPGNTYSSMPIQVDAAPYVNHYLLTVMDGLKYTNRIHVFLPDGSHSHAIEFPDGYFGYKIRMLNIYRFESPGDYYFFGFLFPKTSWTWRDNPRLFVAKITLSGNNFVTRNLVMLGNNDDSKSNFSNLDVFNPAFVNLPDKSLIMVMNQFDKTKNGLIGQIYKVDADLNIVWEKQLPIEGKNITLTYISACPDGNFIISGSHVPNGGTNPEPMLCKIDPNGEVIWKQYYPQRLAGVGYAGTQNPDGTCLLTGNTLAYGQGLNQYDAYLIKTDSQGKVK